jgi:phospholipid/cholesterol/gamma-HCH transport system substrate-binding protein
VTEIRLDPTDRHRILIDVEVNSDIPVTRGTYAQLAMEGITGIAYVHLLDDSQETAPPPKGASGLAELPLKPSFFDTVSDSAEGAVRDARQLMAAINAVLTPENRQRIGTTLASLEKATSSLEAATAKLPQTVARADAWLGPENLNLARDSLVRINETAKTLPQIAGEAEKLVGDLRTLAAEVSKLATQARDLVGEIGQLSAEIKGDTLPQVGAFAESADRSARRIGNLATDISRNPDSVVWGRKSGRPGPGEPGFQ